MQVCKSKYLLSHSFRRNTSLLALTILSRWELPRFVGRRRLLSFLSACQSQPPSATKTPIPFFCSCLLHRLIPSPIPPVTNRPALLPLSHLPLLRHQLHHAENCHAPPKHPVPPVTLTARRQNLLSLTGSARYKVRVPLVPRSFPSRYWAPRGIEYPAIPTHTTFRTLSCQRADITPERFVTPPTRRM